MEPFTITIQSGETSADALLAAMGVDLIRPGTYTAAAHFVVVDHAPPPAKPKKSEKEEAREGEPVGEVVGVTYRRTSQSWVVRLSQSTRLTGE